MSHDRPRRPARPSPGEDPRVPHPQRAVRGRQERRHPQTAAGLRRREAGAAVAVGSAGTRPGAAVNALSAEVLQEVGVDITGERPTRLADEAVAAADLVVVLGAEAVVEPVAGTLAEVRETDEPSARGIEGVERMRLVRDDIAARLRELAARPASA